MDLNYIPEDKVINSNDWDSMSISELYKQQQILYDRYSYLSSINNEMMIPSLQQSIISIEYIISNKLNSPENTHTNNIT